MTREQLLEKFEYNQEEHKGYFNGKLIPSITQLLSIEFPLAEGISASTLAKASERGTSVHNEIEDYNKGFISSLEFQSEEAKNYVSLLCAFNLRIVESETQVFFLDDDEIVCYGTLDQIARCVETTDYANEGDLILLDTKTTSKFDDTKVMWQVNMYRVCCNHEINRVGGIWVRDDNAQIRELPLIADAEVIEKIYELRKKWEER